MEYIVTKCNVLQQINFTVHELETAPESVKDKVVKAFGKSLLIVRSSALSEDTSNGSNAGKYLSLQNIAPQNVLEASKKVAASYDNCCMNNQILVQPMLKHIIMSGVLFTVDPSTGGNYYVINYDETDSADTVTSGEAADLSTCYVFRGKKSGNCKIDRLIDAAEELMQIFSSDKIDMEFAYTAEGKLYLLQARPLILKCTKANFLQQQDALSRVYGFIKREICPKPNVKGKRTIYGVMPDWNPAEIIGIRPKPLALSLYRRLITDGIWAYQRDNYGYKNLRSFPLMIDFCGLPYIDTRVSFNSFIPKEVDTTLTEKLVNYYLDRLERQPDKHDKVEFDIIFSCYTFDLPQRIAVLDEHGFTKKEQKSLQNALRRLTNHIINNHNGLWINDSKKIGYLEKRQKIVKESDLDTISKIYWLLEDCARYGTLPFAGLARAGFIAVLLLKSLVSIGILNEKEYQSYMGELNTITSRMKNDRNKLSIQTFLKQYGHLRPGTYDITSKRYDMAPDLYFGEQSVPGLNWEEEQEIEKCSDKVSFSLTLQQFHSIQTEMERHGLDGDVLALFKFIKAGIEGREYAKFVFTRSLSDALELIAELGDQYGFCREEMAFADISVVDRLYSSSDNPKHILENSIIEGKKKYTQTLMCTMPPVILHADDIYAFHLPTGTPNFITLGVVVAGVCTNCQNREFMSGKILLLPAADPGYDWVFSCHISGFITAYGGANSHMAIRAGELGIPAVIGAGEKLFDRWQKASFLRIDCPNKKVEVLR